MKITKENIFEEAKKRNLEVLKSDLVDKVKDNYGWTPLHRLARKRVKEVLDHPSVDKVKDNYGWTPLHELALRGVKEILGHPSVDKVKDDSGETPLHWLAEIEILTEKDIKKLYPWFKIPKGKITKETVTEIINTPQSIRFIKGD